MMDEIEFTQPDGKFNVAVGQFQVGGKPFYIFASTTDRHAVINAEWRKVDSTNAVLVGAVDDALTGYLLNNTNGEIREQIGLHPSPITKLRRAMGIEDGRGKARWS